jgi:hypothetical protein
VWSDERRTRDAGQPGERERREDESNSDEATRLAPVAVTTFAALSLEGAPLVVAPFGLPLVGENGALWIVWLRVSHVFRSAGTDEPQARQPAVRASERG